MPSYTHVHLRNHFKALGYTVPGNGICAGLAQMSIQAFLAGSEAFSRFNQRLELIATSSPEELSSHIRKAREAIAERSRKKRLDAKLAENEIVIVELSEEERLLTETEAFFDGVEAYLHSWRHRELFAKPVPQPQVQHIIPFIESTTLVEQGGMRVADSFPGIYSLVELQGYFNRLTQVILHYCPPCDIAMGLDCINHRISILFDSKRGVWIMNDANLLPSKEISNPAALADAVIVALAKQTGEGSAATKVVFNTTVYATGKNEGPVKKIMTAVKKSAEFSQAHKITLKKATEKSDVLHVSLANIAAKFGHKDVLKAIAVANPGALNIAGFSGYTPLHLAAELNLSEIVKMLMDEGVSLNTKDIRGNSPLAVSIRLTSVEAMTVLLDEEKSLISTAVNAEDWLPLHMAAAYNKPEVIRFLVKKGADPFAETARGWSAVSLAAAYGCVESLKALIDITPKMNLETAGSGGRTPLTLAVARGHTKLVEWLAEKKIDFNKKSSAGLSALHIAVEKNNLEMVKALIRGGAAVDVEDKAGNTPLHLATSQNKKEIFDLLIKHGASTVKQNNAGMTPLSLGLIADSMLKALPTVNSMLEKIESLQKRFAARDDYQAALEQLHKDVLNRYQKADFSEFYSALSTEAGLTFVAAESDNSAALRLLRAEEKIDFEAKSPGGWLPMHVAVVKDSQAIIDALISEGADLSHEIKSLGATVAYLAAELGLTDMLAKIASKVPVSFLNKAKLGGETPLFIAVMNGHVQTAQFLIEAKVDVNLTSNLGWSPLHLSIEKNHYKIFEKLVDKADLNQEIGSTGVTPVALAAGYGHVECLRVLIGKSPPVDIKKKSTEGITPLISAILNHQSQAAKMLIEALEEKDLNETNNNGDTALHIAIMNNDIELVDALLTKGADVNFAKVHDATTPVQLAVLGHQVEIVNLLRKHGADFQKEDKHGNSALSIGTSFAKAAISKKAIFIAIDAWIDELQQAQPGQLLPAGVDLEFTHLKQLLEKAFKTNYETFLVRYDEASFGNNYYLLIAFIAAEKGYEKILELLLAKIDINAKNPAGLSLSEVAEAHHHPALVRIMHEHEMKLEQKGPAGLPHVGLFNSKTSVPSPSVRHRKSGLQTPVMRNPKGNLHKKRRTLKRD